MVEATFVASSAPARTGPSLVVHSGGYEVRPLLDGYFTMGLGDLIGVAPGEVSAVQTGAGLPADAMDLPVFAFLLRGHGRTMLVDAGTSTRMMDSLGKLPEALDVVGVDRGAIDAVLITHMHPDHLNGITAADGVGLFPNADILIARAEWEYWQSPDRAAEQEPHIRYILASHTHALAPYLAADRVRLFDEGDEVAPGILARLLPGHTAGHTGFAIDDGQGDAMLFWGDALHLVPLQLKCPQCALGHDHDPDESTRTRRRLLGELAGKGAMLAGAHVPAPGIGRLTLEGDAISFVAVEPHRNLERLDG